LAAATSTSLILLVDDDELSLELMTLVEGYRVLSAGTGAEALEQLASADAESLPDLVLTDMQMPDMNGQDLCGHIQQHFDTKGGKRPIVIGMSASRPPQQQLQAFDGFVMKPVDPQELQDVLNRGFRRESAVVASNGKAAEVPAEALDTVVLEKLRKLMPAGALDELFSSYLNDTRVRLAEMERFAVAGDEAAVRRSAHMMKGSAAMTGATGMSRIAALLENGNLPLERQRVLFRELHCACDAIEGTLARDARRTEAHDHQTF
jgi:CheY-like chemotaxis protein